MEAIPTPFDPNCRRTFLAARDMGETPVGILSDVQWEAIGRVLHFTFETQLNSDVADGEGCIYIFRNGRYHDKIDASATTWSYTPKPKSTYECFQFILGPNIGGWESYIDVARITNSVRLTWAISGGGWATNDAKKLLVKHCYGTGTPTDTLATLTRIGAQVNGENGSVSNSAMYASGKWEDPDTLYTSIHVAITTAGETGNAIYTWTWRDWTGTGICQSYADHIFNGIKIRFEENAPYEIGDEWDIIVSLPTEWESGEFAIGGNSTFQIDSINSAGDTTAGPTKTVSLYIPPDAPTITGTPVYVDGSGEIEITFTAPATTPSGLAYYRVYRNWAHMGLSVVDWAPEYSGVIAAGGSVTITVTGLEEGFNRIQATVVDDLGHQSELSEAWEITLNASLNPMGDPPNSPDSICAEMLASGNLEVTVVADSTSDTIYLYWDNQTGTIDYSTVVATITNPRDGYFQRLTAEISSGLTDGIYLIGARAGYAGALEENTDMVCSVLRDKDAAEAVTGLQAEVVYA